MREWGLLERAANQQNAKLRALQLRKLPGGGRIKALCTIGGEWGVYISPPPKQEASENTDAENDGS